VAASTGPKVLPLELFMTEATNRSTLCDPNRHLVGPNIFLTAAFWFIQEGVHRIATLTNSSDWRLHFRISTLSPDRGNSGIPEFASSGIVPGRFGLNFTLD